jgi:hypothetical protein
LPRLAANSRVATSPKKSPTKPILATLAHGQAHAKAIALIVVLAMGMQLILVLNDVKF